MRFLHLIRPVMCVLPEVASPDRKVSEVVSSFRFLFERLVFHVPSLGLCQSFGWVGFSFCRLRGGRETHYAQ